MSLPTLNPPNPKMGWKTTNKSLLIRTLQGSPQQGLHSIMPSASQILILRQLVYNLKLEPHELNSAIKPCIYYSLLWYKAPVLAGAIIIKG